MTMKNTFNTFVNEGAKRFSDLISKAFKEENNELIKSYVTAYNTYQENEKDGVDYLFDLYDTDDINTCFKGGLTPSEQYDMFKLFDNSIKATKFFMFGINHQKPNIMGVNGLELQLTAYATDVIEHMLLFPHCYDREFYYQIFTKNLVD